MELVVGKRFMFDEGLGLHPSVNKTDYELVYIDHEVKYTEKYVVRAFHKGSCDLMLWYEPDFEGAIEI